MEVCVCVRVCTCICVCICVFIQCVCTTTNLLEETEEDISVDGPLVGLVQHDHRVLFQVWVHQTLPEEHTVRHVLDHSLLTGHILKTNQISHLCSVCVCVCVRARVLEKELFDEGGTIINRNQGAPTLPNCFCLCFSAYLFVVKMIII